MVIPVNYCTMELMMDVEKRYVVFIGKLLELHFARLEDAQDFAEGFNFARRQRDKILYQFKNSYKTRGYRFAAQVREWCERMEEERLWSNIRARLTEEEIWFRLKRASRKTHPQG